MKQIFFPELLGESWVDASWVLAWSKVGEVRDKVEEHLGPEGGEWKWIGQTNWSTLPHGIEFKRDEDATLIKMVL